MALTQNQIAAIDSFNNELTLVGELLVKWHVYALDTEFRTKFFQTKQEDPSKYINDNLDRIDPSTLLNIFNGIIWPSIAESDPGLQDHPADVELTSMRGVVLKSVFTNNKLNKSKFNLTFPEKGLPTDFKNLQTATLNLTKTLNVESIDTLTSKQALHLIFKQEVAAKLWLITQYGMSTTFGQPMRLMANLNVYLGYFIMVSGWLSGDLALTLIRGKSLTLANVIKTYLPAFPSSTNYNFDNNPSSADVQSVIASVKLIQTYYEWLQKQKTNENKDYYEGWFNRFFSDKKSIVNMLILINERVNINADKEFKFSNKLASRLTSMGIAYREKFNITLGD